MDEVLFLEDGTLSPLDYKFAEYKEKLFKTHKYQSVLYALLIKENYQPDYVFQDDQPESVQVGRKSGFVCYTRSKNLIKEIKYSEKDFKMATNTISEILNIIQIGGYYPRKTKYLSKCIDCCYRNICV